MRDKSLREPAVRPRPRHDLFVSGQRGAGLDLQTQPKLNAVELDVGAGQVRVDFGGVLKRGCRRIELAPQRQHIAKPDVGRGDIARAAGLVRLKVDGRAEATLGLVEPSFIQVDEPEAEVRVPLLRRRRQVRFERPPRTRQITEVVEAVAEEVMERRLDRRGFGGAFEQHARLGVSLLLVMGQREVEPRAAGLGPVANQRLKVPLRLGEGAGHELAPDALEQAGVRFRLVRTRLGWSFSGRRWAIHRLRG